jgi:hypothetical protein
MTPAKIATSLIAALLAYAAFQLSSAGWGGRGAHVVELDCQALECATSALPPSSNLFL